LLRLRLDYTRGPIRDADRPLLLLLLLLRAAACCETAAAAGLLAFSLGICDRGGK